jgi:CheY-like chemotaxis protein
LKVTSRAVIPRRVLIVDDNRDAAEMLQVGLEILGHTVVTTHDGPSALDVVAQLEPDVALLDIGLPGMDGYELAARIREVLRERSPMLVAVTGYGREADRNRAHAAGFAHHVVKPVDLGRLAELISSLRS